MAQASTYAVAPTVVEVARECDAAWEVARDMIAKGARDDEIYDVLVAKHSELNKTYSIILSMMATGDYSSKAVVRFLEYVKTHPWKDDKDHDETLTVYTALCLRAKYPRISQAEISRARERTRQALLGQRRAMKEMMDRAQSEAELINARRAQARIADLRERVPVDAGILVCGEQRKITVSFDPSQ